MAMIGVHVRNMAFTDFLMTVTPEHELFEDEEKQQSAEQCDADAVDRLDADAFDCMRQQAEQRGSQQGSRRKAHEMRQYADAHRRGREQKSGCGDRAQRAAESREKNDPGKKGHERKLLATKCSDQLVTPAQAGVHPVDPDGSPPARE